MSECVVYWLHDDRCVCPWRHGYIGISQRYSVRLWRHRKDDRWPLDFTATVLFEGTKLECRALEHRLRPHFHIGWNENPGGGKTHGPKISAALKGLVIPMERRARIAATLTGHVRTIESRKKQSDSFKGTTKPVPQREKMAQAGVDRYADRKLRSESYERQRLAKNAKRAARRAAGLPRQY